MATIVFEKLKKAKKDTILSAIEVEVLENKLENIRATNICKEAKIPRSAFYRYFDDVNDAISTFFKYKQQETVSLTKKHLKDSNHDMFMAAIGLFNDLLDNQTFVERIKKMIKEGKEIHIPKIHENNNDMKPESKIEQEIHKIIGFTAYGLISEYVHDKVTKEEARTQFKRYILILEEGYKKEKGLK